MEDDGWLQSAEDAQRVDPEVRAHVSSLVTALGGTSVEEHGRYVLGDDAIAVLKDIRRWIKFYDEKLNRLDVQRILAESNLVEGDLLEILATWSGTQTDNKLKSKVALGCLELLIPLTWPIEIDDELMKVNHHRHLPYLRLAQVNYKRAILHHDTSEILRTIVRLGLPAMSIAHNERTPRDAGIIRLVLYFIRNVALIEQPQDLPHNGDEIDVSRSATIDAFYSQGIFQLLLAICSSMGDEFQKEDVLILDALFHLLKGIDPGKLFVNEEAPGLTRAGDFKGLVQKEKAMLSSYRRIAPSRHNGFGTTCWVKRDDYKITTVTGQSTLHGEDQAFSLMDKTKKWRKPKHRGKQRVDEKESHHFNKPVPLNSSAKRHLRRFIEDFLDSSFNPLFTHLRRAIEREQERVLESVHPRQFLYLISWFLEAECARRNSVKLQEAKRKTNGKARAGTLGTEEDKSFGLVAGVLNQETFVLLNRYMQRAQDNKDWKDLDAGMRCFTQILLTIQEMADSPLEDDQEIAENIQSRIFYEEATHERVIALLRDYKGQGFGYLDACTKLAHVFIRMLERYSKENADLQIRSRRRARQKRKAAELEVGSTAADDAGDADADDIEAVQRVSSERKFDFARFAARFMTQSSIDTFVQLAKQYNDLSKEQLKRAHRFFHRVAFKNDLTTVLFRVDIIQLFHKMIKGPAGLDPASSTFHEWHELVLQVFRRLIKRLQDRPSLMVELLFSKIPSTVFYLEHGNDRETSKIPRPPAELEVKPGREWKEQLGVAVGVLIDQNKSDAIAWVKRILANAKEERGAWEAADEARKAAARTERGEEKTEEEEEREEEEGEEQDETAEALGASPAKAACDQVAPSIYVRPDNAERRTAIFKDNKLRLLMKLSGFDRLGETEDPEAVWIIPSCIASAKLEETLKIIGDFEFAPPIYDDGKSAGDLLRSTAAAERMAAKRRTVFDDDSDGGNSDALAVSEEERLLRQRERSLERYDNQQQRRDAKFPGMGWTPLEWWERGYPGDSKNGARPYAAERLDILITLKRERLRTQREKAEADVDDKERKRDARRLVDLEKRRKIKSDMYVHDSDDETDEERDRAFFAREDMARKRAENPKMNPVSPADQSGTMDRGSAGKKRKYGGRKCSEAQNKKKVKKTGRFRGSSEEGEGSSEEMDVGSEEMEDEGKEVEDDVISIRSDHSSAEKSFGDESSGDESDIAMGADDESPVSSQPTLWVGKGDKLVEVVPVAKAEDSSDYDSGPRGRQPARRNAFVIESDSE